MDSPGTAVVIVNYGIIALIYALAYRPSTFTCPVHTGEGSSQDG
jgi:hypothetical protein